MFSPSILANGVFFPKLLNIPLASCSFINLDFLFLHREHCDNSITQSFLVFIIFELILSVFFFCTLNNKYAYHFYNTKNRSI